ncbi:MAG: Nif3-like dinuclear metal center hexameric protein [Clostridia bacterium]|nr:Nif3-like dinuclear metal center hexameric protein [Clostridia bacterium]
MYSLKEYLSVLESVAPLYLSDEMKKTGMHDNSGIIIDSGKPVNKTLFSLDFTLETVKRAKRLGIDTIVTHHPAIFYPSLTISAVDEGSNAVYHAIKYGLNVISFHLNLDIAENGIDYNLALALGGKNVKVVEPVINGLGYGKEFDVEETDFNTFVSNAKKVFNCKNIIGYKAFNKVKKVASFCGGGANSADSAIVNKKINADTVVTSDVSHHHLRNAMARGVNFVVIPHYVAEEYGFNIFYKEIKQKTDIESFYYVDKRFM